MLKLKKKSVIIFFLVQTSIIYFRVVDHDPNYLASVVDPNTLNLDQNPGFWPNLDPDRG